jgi:hypothetical protein
LFFARMGYRPEANSGRTLLTVRTARAAAGRRSGKTAGLRKRWRRVNNRRSWLYSSKPFAGVGVAYAHHEEAEAEGQHDNVQHEELLCAVICGTREELPSRFRRVERCHPAHRFSRRENWQRYRNLIKAAAGRAPPARTYEIPIFRGPAPSRFQMAFWPSWQVAAADRGRALCEMTPCLSFQNITALASSATGCAPRMQ